jgi:hypothetical protein
LNCSYLEILDDSRIIFQPWNWSVLLDCTLIRAVGRFENPRGSSNVEGIICPQVYIGLTDLSNYGGGIPSPWFQRPCTYTETSNCLYFFAEQTKKFVTQCPDLQTWLFYILFVRHYNPLLIRNRSRILTIHKDRIFWKKPPWKQRNGKKYTSRARTVFTHPGKSGKDLPSSLISIRIPNPK